MDGPPTFRARLFKILTGAWPWELFGWATRMTGRQRFLLGLGLIIVLVAVGYFAFAWYADVLELTRPMPMCWKCVFGK